MIEKFCKKCNVFLVIPTSWSEESKKSRRLYCNICVTATIRNKNEQKYCKTCSIMLVSPDNWAEANKKSCRYYCRNCVKVNANTYYSENAEQISVKGKADRLVNPPKVRVYTEEQRLANNIRAKKWDAEHKEHNKEYKKQYREENPEKIALARKIHYDANRESILLDHSKYYEDNKERILEKERILVKNNPGINSAKGGRARARRAKAIIPTTDFNLIRKLYNLAKAMNAITGTKYHVDHIIPLGKGGDHHHDNMMVVPATFNLRKSDKIISWQVAFAKLNLSRLF